MKRWLGRWRRLQAHTPNAPCRWPERRQVDRARAAQLQWQRWSSPRSRSDLRQHGCALRYDLLRWQCELQWRIGLWRGLQAHAAIDTRRHLDREHVAHLQWQRWGEPQGGSGL